MTKNLASLDSPTFQFLHHFLREDTPGFGGEKVFHREPLSQMCCGKSSNSERWIVNNHGGTHIDLPYHFDLDGKKLHQFSPGFWHTSHCHLIKVKLHPDELLTVEKISSNLSLSLSLEQFTLLEFLILKTDFQSFRTSDIYWKNGPGIHPDVATYLRDHFPALRYIGFDFLSLTSFSQREIGREAHRAFLKHPTHPICIIEDMNLSSLHTSPEKATILPFMVDAADGSPVSILVENQPA